MTLPPKSPTPDETHPEDAPPSHLKPLRVKGHVLAYAVAGILVGSAGLLLVTLLHGSPWRFLLYPLLIGLVLISLSAIVLHLLHRFG